MLYEFMDSYTTSYYTSVVSYIQNDFGIDSDIFYLVQAIASVGLLLVVFIQNLADRAGRKPVMIIVFFGMGLASLIMHLSSFAGSIGLFTFGFLLSWVFFSSDIWVIIVSEEAPAKKRARWSYLIAVVGALGAVAIPICRTIFIGNSTEPAAWRGMNYLAFFAMAFALMGFGMKETNAFLEKKREGFVDKTEKKALRKARLTAPFKSVEPRKRMIAFMFIGLLLGIMAAVISTFEEYLNNIIVDTYGGLPEQVNVVIYVATLGTFVFFGITGLLADKMGRKPTIYLYAGTNVIFFIIMAFSADYFASIGAFWIFWIFGFFMNGSFWGMFMLSKTFCVENFTTGMRGTAAGWRSLMYAIGLISGSLISSFLVRFFDLQYLYLLSSALTAIGVTLFTLFFLPETKGLDIIENTT
jgi:MFS family permease